MENFNLNTVIVGAGVVGMALARALAMRGVELAVLESEPFIGSVVSARNSGVIHAGLYYKPGSLKARLCVSGAAMLYDYAAAHDIWHERCGKFVVATRVEEVEALHDLKHNAEENGVKELQILTSAQAQALEPEINCVEALHSPASGMIDVHGLLEAFSYDATSHGALIQCRARFIRAEVGQDGGFAVHVEGEEGVPYVIHCRQLINAGGLDAQKIAAAIEGFDHALIPEQILGKGSYFFLQGQKAPFHRLIYPMPAPGSSGLHCRRDINGRTVFGPDFEIVDDIDYRVDPARAVLFYESVKRYYPKIQLDNLVPDYSGVRPKLKTHGDFILQYEETHKMPGLVNYFGIDSPGLTSCMALAEDMAQKLSAE